MGIPHLITHLRPYAVSGDLTGRTTVIDGPAFAYHIFHLCLASRHDAKNPFEGTPSYALIGKTAIQWLDALLLRDVRVRKIYFDGFLPASKRLVRGQRLKSYTKALSSYHEAFPQVIPPSPQLGSASGSPIDLFSPKAVPASLTKIPAAPFLVPAIIESLSRSSVFRDIVEVVPGEAELFCAQDVKQNGGTVLTGDSDLLVHDLGDGSVSFFRDMLLVSTKGLYSVRCVQYKLQEIADRLELPRHHGIRSLAFEISLDVHLTFPQLLARARNLESATLHKGLYEEFSSQYECLSVVPKSTRTSPILASPPSTLKLVLHYLDPRISEYVLQFPSIANEVGLETPLKASSVVRLPVEVFMPFLLDSPAKTSAWEISTPVRQLAYGLLNLAVPERERVATILESRRVQSSAGAGREWSLPDAAQMEEACEEMMVLISRIRSSYPDMNATSMWRTITLHQDVTWGIAIDKLSLSRTLIEKTQKDKVPRIYWDMVHFVAQIHGSYYSFRILQQILNVVYALRLVRPIPGPVLLLHRQLQTLPGLMQLQPLEEFPEWLTSSEANEMLGFVRGMLGLEMPPPEGTATSKKSDKKKRKREAVIQGLEESVKRPANMFELLGSE